MFKWMSEGMKEKLRRLYFFFFVLFYSLSVIFMKLDEWYSFKPLVISLAYTAIILIVLVHFLNNKKVHSQFLDLFLRFSWLNLILNWTISHLTMVTIVSLYFISQASTSSIFLIATVLVLIIVHISIKYLQDKKVPVDSPYVVLWLGLISTFIGFTLSGYAQEAFKEKDDKENLIATIDLALAQEDNRNDRIEDKLAEIILKVKEKDEIFLDDIKVSLPKNNALEQIINKGDLYNRLSPDGRSTFSFSFNFNPEISLNDAEIQKELKEEFERVKSKQRSKEFEKFTRSSEYFYKTLYKVQYGCSG
ncbi:hypothetical protein ACFVSS_13220 [Peribacillus butanolivorans]|uniref:hypothetical protein n=1 Tax=Peribacillus butanolivorans TaxID=421767 RepID=UPI0036DB286D